MKTGEPKQRLSEKLNADMERIREENAASIDAQLQSFRTDLKTIAENALATIRDDTDRFLLTARQQLLRQKPQHETPYWKEIAILAVAICVTSAGIWLATRLIGQPTPPTFGLTVIERPEATFLILDNERAVLTRCTLAGQDVDCIRIGKE